MTKVGLRMALPMGRIGKGERLFREEGGSKTETGLVRVVTFQGTLSRGGRELYSFLVFYYVEGYLCG